MALGLPDDSAIAFSAIAIFLAIMLVYIVDLPPLLGVAFALVAFLFMYFTYKYNTMKNVMAVVGVILALLVIGVLCFSVNEKMGSKW